MPAYHRKRFISHHFTPFHTMLSKVDALDWLNLGPACEVIISQSKLAIFSIENHHFPTTTNHRSSDDAAHAGQSQCDLGPDYAHAGQSVHWRAQRSHVVTCPHGSSTQSGASHMLQPRLSPRQKVTPGTFNGHFSLRFSIENAERMENCPWKWWFSIKNNPLATELWWGVHRILLASFDWNGRIFGTVFRLKNGPHRFNRKSQYHTQHGRSRPPTPGPLRPRAIPLRKHPGNPRKNKLSCCI